MKRIMLNVLRVSLCLLILAGCRKNSVYNVLEFGAVADGKTLNTAAINEAIRKCNGAGGGTVVIPAGKYITGTLLLLSNIDLHLEPGAQLLGSKDTGDYKVMPNVLFQEGYSHYGLIYAVDAKNISISGTGEINGNGTFFMNGIDKPHMGHDFDRSFTRQQKEFMKEGSVFEDGPVSYPFRPGLMIVLERCENIHLTDVVLKDSPEWTIRVGDCDNVDIKGITITNNQLIPNSDGIHCTNSRNVRISNCDINVGDDAIIVTGFGDGVNPGQISSDTSTVIGNKTGYAENVTVTNCTLSSRSSCIRIGYGHHPIRNLVFNNLVLYSSNRGIGIFSRNNTSIENVMFNNITMSTRLHDGHWWGKGEPIHISAVKDDSTGNAGKIRSIGFSNIEAISETGILIYGSPGSLIEDVRLNDVRLTVKRGKFSATYGGNFDLRPAETKANAIFEHDIPGIYAQYVKGLKISGFDLSWGDNLPDFFTNGIEVNHFENVTLEGNTINPAFSAHGLFGIAASDGSGLRMRNNSSLENKDHIQNVK